MRALKRQWFALTSGLACFLWALLGLLTTIPNQDILADGIQVQSVLADPRIVLAFPGQKHAGPLEYPFSLLAEWLAPGNFYANGAVRPLLAFITGFLVAKLFQTLFPNAPRWGFLTAIVVGPTIIHGLLGPDGNTVGVWWLQPNWDTAWLFVTAGALVIATVLKPDQVRSSLLREWIFALLGGVLLGLGFFAHPAISLLVVPLLALVLLLSRRDLLIYLFTACGFLVGVAPAAISYVVNARINTWDPSHGAFISVDYYWHMGRAVLGLDGIPDYMLALLPFGLGLAPSTNHSIGQFQSIVCAAFIVAVLVTSIFGIRKSIKARSRLQLATAVAVAWVVAIITMFAFITFIDPVWIYSSGLSILFWISVGALPSFFSRDKVGVVITVVVLAIASLSTLEHNWSYFTNIKQNITAKAQTNRNLQDFAHQLEDAGARYVFGSYYDAIPIGYASSLGLRTLTNHYNRFPLTSEELQLSSIVVAVNMQPKDAWGIEAVALVSSKCRPQQSIESTMLSGIENLGKYQLFLCPPQALVFNR